MKTVNFATRVTRNRRVSLAHAMNNPERYQFAVNAKWYSEPQKVKWYDEYGYSAGGVSNANLYVCSREYGPEMVVHAQNEQDAWSAFIDECTPIASNEVHDAYNAFDKLVEHMESLGHENTRELREFCTRWDKWYFETDTKYANHTGAWDRWELDEAYEMQSNATDTGIVHVGHYTHVEKVSWDNLIVTRKPRS